MEYHILHDSTYMQCPEQESLWRQKVDEWLCRAGVEGNRVLATGYRTVLRGGENVFLLNVKL